MIVHLRIQRFDPNVDQKPYYQEFEVELEPTDRLLDGLNAVKWYKDGTLGFRRSCAHGVCGSDAMRINGKNMLACKVLVKTLTQPITIEPMMGFPVIKDLIVDMEAFFEKYKAVKPYLIAHDETPQKERIQSQAEREVFDDTTKCILCGACTTSCPTFWANGEYIGPAAIVNAHRFIFDSRDQAAEEHLAVLGDDHGVFGCRTAFNCTEACPRDINITKAIAEVKRKLIFNPIKKTS